MEASPGLPGCRRMPVLKARCLVDVSMAENGSKWLENQLVAARRAGEHKTPHEYHPRDVPEGHMRRYPTWEAVGGHRLVYKVLKVCT